MNQSVKGDHCDPTSPDSNADEHDMKTRDVENLSFEEYGAKNPSPTPEILEAGRAIAGDAIGDTVFSERWVLQALMKLTELVSNKSTENRPTDDDDDEESVQELDKDIETQLCQLWDMTATKDVVNFLLGLPSLNVIADAMTRTKMPRLTEIVVGIVGNMACVEDALKKITEHPKIKFSTLQLLDISDPLTLTEIFRLFLICMQNKNYSASWLKSFHDDEHFLPHLTFIMASSTNNQLLSTAADFVDCVLDISDDLCSSWATSEFVDSLLEAVQQVGFKNLKIVETFLHVLQLLSTSNEGKIALALHAHLVVKVSSLYLNCICICICKSESFHTLLKGEHSPGGSQGKQNIDGHEPGIASALMLLHILLLSSRESVTENLTEEKTLVHVLKLAQMLGSLQEMCKTKTGSLLSVETGGEPRMLQEIVEGAVITLLEEVLDNETGRCILVNTMEESTEGQCQNVLAWLKHFPGGQRCYCQLQDAISELSDNCNRLANVLHKLENASEVGQGELHKKNSTNGNG